MINARLHVMNVYVDDQEKALAFYTDKLGFVPKTDLPVGDYRWLTVVPADQTEGVELLLEPDENPATQAFKAAIREAGIPAASFAVDDVAVAHRELTAMGVQFVQPPVPIGLMNAAVLDDTCGNLIQLVSPA